MKHKLPNTYEQKQPKRKTPITYNTNSHTPTKTIQPKVDIDQAYYPKIKDTDIQENRPTIPT